MREITACKSENAQRFWEHAHGDARLQQLKNPILITSDFQMRRKKMSGIHQFAPEKRCASQSIEIGKSQVHQRRQCHAPVGKGNSLGVHQDRVGEQNVDRGILLEEGRHSAQGAGQILFVAVQIGTDFPPRSHQPAIDGIVHAVVFFNEQSRVVFVMGGTIRDSFKYFFDTFGAAILNDMFDFGAFLVSDRGHSQSEPIELSKAGRYN